MRIRLWTTAALAILAGCNGCPGEELAQLVASPECTQRLDFGTVDISQIETRSFQITNEAGERQFDEMTIELLPESDPAFSLATDPLPTQVEAGQVEAIEVSVRPEVANQITGKVRVQGRVAEDGSQVPEEQRKFSCDIELTAIAVNNGLPDIDCTPTPVDFGRVGQGDTGRRQVTCRNVGIRDLLIAEVRLDKPNGSPFNTSTQIPVDTAFRPNDSFTVDLTFTPLDTETHTATLHILSNDLDEEDLEIPLTGAGQVAPSCRVEFVDDITGLEPQTTVRLNGVGETTITGAHIAHYLWSLSYRPPGSTTTLESQGEGNPRGVDLDIPCDAMGDCSTRIDVLADVAGTFEVTLVVEDNEGIRSPPCSEQFRAVPKEQLHVQLVWDHPTADLDLHFIRDNGPAFNHVTDCYFSNRFPTWWGMDAQDPRNPRLDLDDQGGFGPENINVVEPAPGNYRIAVHYWNSKTQGDPATLATVRVYVRGQLAMEQTQFFSGDQVMWDVADIVWPDDVEAPPDLSPLDNLQNYPRPF